MPTPDGVGVSQVTVTDGAAAVVRGRSAAFPTTPSDRDVAALQALLVRVARSLS